MTIFPEIFAPLAGRPFYKMNGLGNDFYIIDLRGSEIRLMPEMTRILGDRSQFGCDQIITLQDNDDEKYAVYMGIWNADGSDAGACGNAARCVAHLLTQESYDDETRLNEDVTHFMSPTGALTAIRQSKWTYSVAMGKATFMAKDIPLRDPKLTQCHEIILEGFEQFGPASLLSIGNPHMVFFVKEDVDIFEWGPKLVDHSIFPDGANISFARILNKPKTEHGAGLVATQPEQMLFSPETQSAIDLVVWERGAGPTKACGTAACAATAAGIKRGLLQDEVFVYLPGGRLQINKTNGGLTMTGLCAMEFSGLIKI